MEREKVKTKEMTAQDRLEKDYFSLIKENSSRLELSDTPVLMNMAVDIGTSKPRAIDFRTNTNTVNPSDIIRIQNKYAILNASDIEDLSLLEFEEKSLSNMCCFKMRNLTNINSPISKEIVVSKGLVSDKLVKTSSYSVSNLSKYDQVNEYIINTYSAIISCMYSNMVYYLERGEVENARRVMNVELNLAYMLPDEERLSRYNETLKEAIQGVVEFELPMFNGLRGRFSIRSNAPNQWLDLYGEAESAIYYYLIKHRTPENMRAYKDHGVTVIDVGEGSMDIVFFKERELIARASATSRIVNGSALISRTIRNIENDAFKKGIRLSPSVEQIKSILEKDPENLILETPTVKNFDISDALTKAKEEISGEMANIFKNTFEKNTVLGGVDNLYLAILAGRTMLGTEKSPSLGEFLAERLEEQLMIPKSVCKITHPDSNLLGAALKLSMKINKYKK